MIQVTILNESLCPRPQSVVFYQEDFGQPPSLNVIAWYVIRNLRYEYSHPFRFDEALEFQLLSRNIPMLPRSIGIPGNSYTIWKVRNKNDYKATCLKTTIGSASDLVFYNETEIAPISVYIFRNQRPLALKHLASGTDPVTLTFRNRLFVRNGQGIQLGESFPTDLFPATAGGFQLQSGMRSLKIRMQGGGWGHDALPLTFQRFSDRRDQCIHSW